MSADRANNINLNSRTFTNSFYSGGRIEREALLERRLEDAVAAAGGLPDDLAWRPNRRPPMVFLRLDPQTPTLAT
jgi:hypothetical protein